MVSVNDALTVSALKDLLGGASQAFWTSIAGLACSIVFGQSVRQRHHAVLGKIEAFDSLLETRIPVVTPEAMAYRALCDSAKQNHLLGRALGLMNDQQTAAEGVADRLVEAVGQVECGITEMSKNQSEMLGKLMDQTMTEFETRLAKEIRGMTASFKETADSVGGAVEALGTMLETVKREVLESAQALDGAVASMQAAVSDTQEKLTVSGEAMAAAMEAVELKLSQTCTEAKKAVDGMADRVTSAAGAMSQAAEDTPVSEASVFLRISCSSGSDGLPSPNTVP